MDMTDQYMLAGIIFLLGMISGVVAACFVLPTGRPKGLVPFESSPEEG
jgi:hypothetical protein